MSYRKLWKSLEASVHAGPGELPPAERRGAWSVDGAPEVARTLVEKLHARPAEIEDAITVCAAFQVINRIADAMEFHVPTEDKFARAAPIMLKRGYKFS